VVPVSWDRYGVGSDFSVDVVDWPIRAPEIWCSSKCKNKRCGCLNFEDIPNNIGDYRSMVGVWWQMHGIYEEFVGRGIVSVRTLPGLCMRLFVTLAWCSLT